MRERADHADALVHRLVAVADRAEADRTMRDTVAQAFSFGPRVERPVAISTVRARNLPSSDAASEAVVLALQAVTFPRDEIGAVAFRLFAQARQQRAAVDALKAGVIVAFRNERGTAFAGVDNLTLRR